MKTSAALVERARLHVRRHFARHIPKWMTFHDLEHTLAVVRAALDIGGAMGIGADRSRVLELAALFHDTGYATAYHGHEKKSAALAKAFLSEQGAGAALVRQVSSLIMATRMGVPPRTPLQRILRDADSAKAGQVDFHEKSERLRAELEHVRRKRIPAHAWNAENLEYLRKHRFYTPYAERRFAKQKALNLRKLAERARLPEEQLAAPAFGVERFFDRDLSWLAFNARVLQEAQDERVPLLERLKATLKEKAEDVRVTTRLVDSPACLVSPDDGMSLQLARLLRQAGQPAPATKPVLEVNAEHALVNKLDASAHFDDLAHIVFDQALLAEGGLPEDPAAYVKRVNALLQG